MGIDLVQIMNGPASDDYVNVDRSRLLVRDKSDSQVAA